MTDQQAHAAYVDADGRYLDRHGRYLPTAEAGAMPVFDDGAARGHQASAHEEAATAPLAQVPAQQQGPGARALAGAIDGGQNPGYPAESYQAHGQAAQQQSAQQQFDQQQYDQQQYQQQYDQQQYEQWAVDQAAGQQPQGGRHHHPAPSSYQEEYTPPPEQLTDLAPATEAAPAMPAHVLASLMPQQQAGQAGQYAQQNQQPHYTAEQYANEQYAQQPGAEQYAQHQAQQQYPAFEQTPQQEPAGLPHGVFGRSEPGTIPAGLIDPSAGRVAAPTQAGPASGIIPAVAAVDWNLVAMFRAQASERLVERLGDDRGKDLAAEKETGREIIRTIVDDAAADLLHDGEKAWSYEEQKALETATYNALFGLGRLQPLIDDDTVENIIISGAENVWVETTDGELIRKDPVAGSDKELLEELAFVAQRSESNARNFTSAHPRLHMRLDGGSRLAAAAWVTARPSVVIRRHRLRRVALDDLVGRDMLTPNQASFLGAAIRARKSVVVAGPQGAGKTTMVRALCAQIPRHEAIGTFETEFELHLHELPDVHEIVHAWEARPGSGEVGPDGRQAGEFGLDEALYDSFRFNLTRQIVGEVRGAEVWAMIKAMESGAGSISTTHAADGEAAVRKLVTCAMEAGAHVTRELATTKLAETIDIVVQVTVNTTQDRDDPRIWRKTRRVSEIVHVSPGEAAKGYATTHVFRPDPRGGPALPGTMPDELRELERHGFDLTGFLAAEGQEAGPV